VAGYEEGDTADDIKLRKTWQDVVQTVIEDYDIDMLAPESEEAVKDTDPSQLFEDIEVNEEPQAVSTDGKTEGDLIIKSPFYCSP